RERIVAVTPNCSELRPLAVLFNKLGKLDRRTLGAEQARDWYVKALEVVKRMVQAEPANVDMVRYLMTSHENLLTVTDGDEYVNHWCCSITYGERLAELTSAQSPEDGRKLYTR